MHCLSTDHAIGAIRDETVRVGRMGNDDLTDDGRATDFTVNQTVPMVAVAARRDVYTVPPRGSTAAVAAPCRSVLSVFVPRSLSD